MVSARCNGKWEIHIIWKHSQWSRVSYLNLRLLNSNPDKGIEKDWLGEKHLAEAAQ